MSEKNTNGLKPLARIYWLKLFYNYFDDDTIRFIEGQKNGILYSYFYLNLLTRALNMESDGMLVRYIGNKVIPHDAVSLAELTHTNIDTVRCALTLFLEIGLVERLDNGYLYLPRFKEMVGSECEAAERMRKKRARDKERQSLGNIVQECIADDSEESQEPQEPEAPQESQGYTTEDSTEQEESQGYSPYNFTGGGDFTEQEEPEEEYDIRRDFITCSSFDEDVEIPTPKQVFDFYKTYRLVRMPHDFYNYQQNREWKDEYGNRIKNWRGAYRTIDAMYQNEGGKNELHNPNLIFDPGKYI